MLVLESDAMQDLMHWCSPGILNLSSEVYFAISLFYITNGVCVIWLSLVNYMYLVFDSVVIIFLGPFFANNK